MALTPWLTGDLILASRLNRTTRCAGPWSAAGHEVYLPAAAFHPRRDVGDSLLYACVPHTVAIDPVAAGEWLTLPMPTAIKTGAACLVALPAAWNGALNARVWHLDASLVASRAYVVTVRVGVSGPGEDIGSNHGWGWTATIPAGLSTHGLLVSNWLGLASPPGVAEGDLLWVLVARDGDAPADTVDESLPFVGLSLSFQTMAITDR